MWHKRKLPKKNKCLIIMTEENYEVAVLSELNGKTVFETNNGIYYQEEVVMWRYFREPWFYKG